RVRGSRRLGQRTELGNEGEKLESLQLHGRPPLGRGRGCWPAALGISDMPITQGNAATRASRLATDFFGAYNEGDGHEVLAKREAPGGERGPRLLFGRCSDSRPGGGVPREADQDH